MKHLKKLMNLLRFDDLVLEIKRHYMLTVWCMGDMEATIRCKKLKQGIREMIEIYGYSGE